MSEMRELDPSCREDSERKIWREPILIEYDVDQLTAAAIAPLPDGPDFS